MIAKDRFASEKDIGKVKQTANHHRHLGNRRKKYPLPNNPVSLNEDIEFTRFLLKQWQQNVCHEEAAGADNCGS